MTERLIEIGRCYGMEINVDKAKVMRSSRQPSTVLIMIDQTKVQNVEYLNYFGSMITNDARCTLEIKSRISVEKQHSTRRRIFSPTNVLNLSTKLVKYCICIIDLYGAKTLTLRKVDQKLFESFEMWFWRKMEKISWTDRVRNDKVLYTVKEGRNILHKIKRRKSKWMDGRILLSNCLLKHTIEGKIEGRIEVTGRQAGRRKQL